MIMLRDKGDEIKRCAGNQRAQYNMEAQCTRATEAGRRQQGIQWFYGFLVSQTLSARRTIYLYSKCRWVLSMNRKVLKLATSRETSPHTEHFTREKVKRSPCEVKVAHARALHSPREPAAAERPSREEGASLPRPRPLPLRRSPRRPHRGRSFSFPRLATSSQGTGGDAWGRPQEGWAIAPRASAPPATNTVSLHDPAPLSGTWRVSWSRRRQNE